MKRAIVAGLLALCAGLAVPGAALADVNINDLVGDHNTVHVHPNTHVHLNHVL